MRMTRTKINRWGAALVCALALRAGATDMSVQVQNGPVRATPSFLGRVVATTAYGDRVSVLKTQGDWSEVQAGGQTGWMHQSALTRKKVQPAAGGETARAGASSGELALAGKGFNKDVEAQFKADNQAIDFTWVDRMLTFRHTPDELAAFLREGGVTVPTEGGAR